MPDRELDTHPRESGAAGVFNPLAHKVKRKTLTQAVSSEIEGGP
jgi:hypothetical protein